MANRHICGELRHQVNEFARAPLPHLRENPANCGTHFLYHPMRLLAPGISEIHANNAPILGINVTRDPAFFLQRRQHSGDAAGTGLQRRRQLRWRLRPLMDSSRSTNCSPWAPRVNSLCIVERLPHTLAYSSLTASCSNPIRAPSIPIRHTAERRKHPKNISHRKQFITRNYFWNA